MRRSGAHQRGVDQCGKPFLRIRAIIFLGAIATCEDDQFALGRHPAARECLQSAKSFVFRCRGFLRLTRSWHAVATLLTFSAPVSVPARNFSLQSRFQPGVGAAPSGAAKYAIISRGRISLPFWRLRRHDLPPAVRRGVVQGLLTISPFSGSPTSGKPTSHVAGFVGTLRFGATRSKLRSPTTASFSQCETRRLTFSDHGPAPHVLGGRRLASGKSIGSASAYDHPVDDREG